jgi:hypothetical protein
MRVKIRLDTIPDAYKFSAIASQLEGKIYIVDAHDGLKVNAKSVLGALYSMEFGNLWCESEKDIYHAIEEFIIIE